MVKRPTIFLNNFYSILRVWKSRLKAGFFYLNCMSFFCSSTGNSRTGSISSRDLNRDTVSVATEFSETAGDDCVALQAVKLTSVIAEIKVLYIVFISGGN